MDRGTHGLGGTKQEDVQKGRRRGTGRKRGTAPTEALVSRVEEGGAPAREQRPRPPFHLGAGEIHLPIGQRLMACIAEWKKIKADRRVRIGVTADWLYPGAERDLQKLKWPRPYKGSLIQMRAYRELLAQELEQKIVQRVEKQDLRWCNPSFLVPKPGGEWRKVVDCRMLNEFVKDRRFKMEDLETALKMARKGDYATKIDIKLAYNHIPVQKSFMPYLGFTFAGSFYTYRTMPFGLKSAPRLFTKVMRPVIWYIRRRWRARVVVYMDDVLMLFDDRETAATTTTQVMSWMQSLGWKLSVEKCQMVPQQQVTFLGWVLDLRSLQLKMTKQRRRRLMDDGSQP
jgi:hypothetical protein